MAQRRLPTRLVIVSGDIIRAAILPTIPLAWALDVLSMLQLYLVGALVGIVTGGQIGDGNGKLETGQQTAGAAGPTLASGLVTAIGAPLTVGLTTSICMALSSLCVGLTRR